MDSTSNHRYAKPQGNAALYILGYYLINVDHVYLHYELTNVFDEFFCSILSRYLLSKSLFFIISLEVPVSMTTDLFPLFEEMMEIVSSLAYFFSYAFISTFSIHNLAQIIS